MEEISSVDEAALYYGQELEGMNYGKVMPQNFGLIDEDIFWGHCSNLQPWVDHEYDTRLLHTNLSFPLLIALSEANDPKARAAYKDEVAKRYIEGTEEGTCFL